MGGPGERRRGDPSLGSDVILAVEEWDSGKKLLEGVRERSPGGWTFAEVAGVCVRSPGWVS